VCLYQLACRPTPANAIGAPEAAAANSGQLERLAGLIEETMIAAEYSPTIMRDANRLDLRVLLRRLGPSAQDTRRIMGIFRRILWRLARGSENKS
jgi:tRNA/rRNA methyltransferase